MELYVKFIILILFYIFINYLCNCKEKYNIELINLPKKQIKQLNNNNNIFYNNNNNKLFSKESNIQSGYSNIENYKMEIIKNDTPKEIICRKDNLDIDEKILKLNDKLEHTRFVSNIDDDDNQKIIENIIYINNVEHCDFL